MSDGIHITVTHRIEIGAGTLAGLMNVAREFAAALNARAPAESPSAPFRPDGNHADQASTVAKRSSPPPALKQPEKGQISATPDAAMLAEKPASATSHELNGKAPVSQKPVTAADDGIPRGLDKCPISPQEPATVATRTQPADPGPPRRPAVEASAMAPAAPPVRAYAERTPQREAMLRRMYEDWAGVEQIEIELNELPGPSIGAAQVVAWIGALALKRKVKAPAGVPVAPGPAAPAPIPVTMGQPTALAGSLGSIVASAERKAIIQRDWPTRRPKSEILAEINALPGPPMSGSYADAIASKLGLYRPSAATMPQETPATPVADSIAEKHRAETPTVDWPAAEQWAGANGVNPPAGTSRPTLRLLINDRRRQLGLPQWNIVEARGPVQKLTAPTFGGAVA